MGFLKGFLNIIKGVWGVVSQYPIQALILVLLGLYLYFCIRYFKKPEEAQRWPVRFLRAVNSFIKGLLKLVIQSPLLILMTIMVVLIRTGRIQTLFRAFLKGVGIDVGGEEAERDYVEFEAEGEAPGRDRLQRVIEEGRKLLIPPPVNVRELSRAELEDYKDRRIKLHFQRGRSPYYYNSIYLPALDRNYTLPRWLDFKDIEAVVMDEKKRVEVLVLKKEGASEAKKEWDELFGIG